MISLDFIRFILSISDLRDLHSDRAFDTVRLGSLTPEVDFPIEV